MNNIITKNEILKLYSINHDTMRLQSGISGVIITTTKGVDITDDKSQGIYFFEGAAASMETIDAGVEKINKYLNEGWGIYESAEVVSQVKPEWIQQPQPTTSSKGMAAFEEIMGKYNKEIADGIASLKEETPIPEKKKKGFFSKYGWKIAATTVTTVAVYMGYKAYRSRNTYLSQEENSLIDESIRSSGMVDSSPREII